MALVSLKDILLAANIAPPPTGSLPPQLPLGDQRRRGGVAPLLNTMWDNELLMFINETQLIERREGRQMSRRTKRKREGGGQSAFSP